jgi:hypothetical protein
MATQDLAKETQIGLTPEGLEQLLGDRSIGQEFNNYSSNDLYAAALKTNEIWEPKLAEAVKHANPQYLIGVGFGNILTQVLLFKPGNLKGFFSVDISPNVVAVGRAVRHLLKVCETAEDFVRIVKDETSLENELEIPNLKIKTMVIACLRKRVHFYDSYIYNVPKRERTQEELIELINGTRSMFYVQKESETEHKIYHPDTLAVLLQNYPLFRRLAIEGKMGILESDVHNKEVLQEIRKLKDYNLGNNVIYLSNLPRFMDVDDIINSTIPEGHTSIISYGLDRHKILALGQDSLTYELFLNEPYTEGIIRNAVIIIKRENENEYHIVGRSQHKNGSTHQSYIYHIDKKDEAGKVISGELTVPGPSDYLYRFVQFNLDHFDWLFGLPYENVHTQFGVGPCELKGKS